MDWMRQKIIKAVQTADERMLWILYYFLFGAQ